MWQSTPEDTNTPDNIGPHSRATTPDKGFASTAIVASYQGAPAVYIVFVGTARDRLAAPSRGRWTQGEKSGKKHGQGRKDNKMTTKGKRATQTGH